MTADQLEEQRQRLTAAGQARALQCWNELDGTGRSRLAAQASRVDLEQITRLFHQWQASRSASAEADGGTVQERDSARSRAARAQPPSDLVRLPRNDREQAAEAEAVRSGETLLRAGKVAGVLVAGGQGTRLRFDRPKGMYPIGPVSGATLFQLLAEQMLARSRRYQVAIPWLIMTSDATHEETVECFAEQKHFGLEESQVHFFRQGNMPAVDDREGQLLLAGKDSLCLSPNGHGGILSALADSGLMQLLAEQGIDVLHYHQVDNPTAVLCDPALIGWHVQRDSEMTTKVAARRSGLERMGVVADVDGQTQIIEYSDMPEEAATRTDDEGRLLLWAGNMAIHVISRSFLERLLNQPDALPLHVAHKVVEHLDETGNLVRPESPNALKFERFIFDALPQARRALVVEADRAAEFNPVKNYEGTDTPAESQAGMLQLYRRWLEAAGATMTETARVEISPLTALDEAETRLRVESGTHFAEDCRL